MQINHPMIITARLLPGVQVGDSFISVEETGEMEGYRVVYRYHIDMPDAAYDCGTVSGPKGMVNHQSMLCSVLSFLSAAAEAYRYHMSSGYKSENYDMFPERVTEWAYMHDSEISSLHLELTEKTLLIP